MIEYSEAVSFPGRAVRLLHLAERIVGRIHSKHDDGSFVLCHEVSRIVQGVLSSWPLEVHDGKYGIGMLYEHSWLTYIASRPCHKFILDPYAMDQLPMVQILDLYLPHSRLYIPELKRQDIKHDFINNHVKWIKLIAEKQEWGI